MEMEYSTAERFGRVWRNRKEESFNSPDVDTEEVVLPKEAYDAFKKYDQEQIGVADPFSDLPEHIDMVFILRLADGREVIVNTEGFNYCRYFAFFRIL